MCWSKRHLPLLLVAGLACTITITYAADPVSDVLEKYFGKLVEDAQAKEKLVSHLDTLLKLGAKRPGEGLRVVHEYEDEKAKTLGVEVVPTLTAGSVNAWADQALELLRGVDEGHTYSLLRRVITAALLKLWLEGGQKLPDGSSDKLKEVMLKVRRGRTGSQHAARRARASLALCFHGLPHYPFHSTSQPPPSINAWSSMLLRSSLSHLTTPEPSNPSAFIAVRSAPAGQCAKGCNGVPARLQERRNELVPHRT